MPDKNDDVTCDACQALYERVAQRARASDRFADIDRTETSLRCAAKDVESQAWYLVEAAGPQRDQVIVGLYTPDRWLSESIEADLMHLGDDLEELLDEELVEQGYEQGPLEVEHFRDDQKLYVFRSVLPVPADGSLDDAALAQRVAQVLLAYEACFHELGDMAGDAEE